MLSFIIVIPVMFSSGCITQPSDVPSLNEPDPDAGQNDFDPLDQPDRLGTWSQTYPYYEREQDWQQIVFDSPFQLGEPKVMERYETAYGVRENYYQLGFGTYPNINGTSSAIALAIEFARQHLGFDDRDANFFVDFSKTEYAYLNLIVNGSGTDSYVFSESLYMDGRHPVDLIIVTEPSEKEMKLAESRGFSLIYEAVYYDAFVFFTYQHNPVDSLTLDQIRGIYSGRITNWKEVGGEDVAIAAFQREESTDSQVAMMNLVMGDTPMMAPEIITVSIGNGYLVDVATEYRDDKASIGYTYRSNVDILYKDKSIKMLKIDGFFPDEENLRTGSYPLTVVFYGVIQSNEENTVVGDYLNWMISPEGQLCVRQAGYIPYYQ